MAALNFRYSSDALVERIIKETGQRPNLIAIICDYIIKKMDITSRIIDEPFVEEALDSSALQSAVAMSFSGEDSRANHMDKIVVYSTVHRENFTMVDIINMLKSHSLSYTTEEVKESLKRLELSFIIGRQKDTYFYRVPLFKTIYQIGREELLDDKIRLWKEKS